MSSSTPLLTISRTISGLDRPLPGVDTGIASLVPLPTDSLSSKSTSGSLNSTVTFTSPLSNLSALFSLSTGSAASTQLHTGTLNLTQSLSRNASVGLNWTSSTTSESRYLTFSSISNRLVIQSPALVAASSSSSVIRTRIRSTAPPVLSSTAKDALDTSIPTTTSSDAGIPKAAGASMTSNTGIPLAMTSTAANGRSPSLNADESNTFMSSGTFIGSLVGGVIAAIVVIVAIFWCIGKRRRKKFVRPMIERLHPNGSQFSFTGTTGILASPYKRTGRSRALSIESASTFGEGDSLHSPGLSSNNSPAFHDRVIPSDGINALGHPRHMTGVSDRQPQIYKHGFYEGDHTAFVPVGGTLLSHHKASSTSNSRHRTVDSMGSVAFDLIQSPPRQHRPQHSRQPSFGQYGYLSTSRSNSGHGHDDSQVESSGSSGHDHHSGSAQASISGVGHSHIASDTTHATTVHPHDLIGSTESKYAAIPGLVINGMISSQQPSIAPFEDLDTASPLSYSPRSAVRATLLERRTTDPFGKKSALRVINPDRIDPFADPDTNGSRPSLVSLPSIANNRPNSFAVSSPRRPASIISRNSACSGYSDVYYDGHIGKLAGDAEHRSVPPEGQYIRPAGQLSLDFSSLTPSLTRDDSSSVYTPNEVNQVGFFRDG